MSEKGQCSCLGLDTNMWKLFCSRLEEFKLYLLKHFFFLMFIFEIKREHEQERGKRRERDTESEAGSRV